MTRSTQGKGPWELIWTSDRLELADVRRVELHLKRQKGGNGFYQLTGYLGVKIAPRRGGAAPATKSLAAPTRVRKFHAAQSSANDPE